MTPGVASILPEIFLAAGSLLAFTLGAARTRVPAWLLQTLSLIASVGSLVAGLLALATSLDTRGTSAATTAYLGLLDTGEFGRFFVVLVSLVVILTLLVGYRYGRDRGLGCDEYHGVLLSGGLGMQLTAAAVHWITFFLGLELLSVSLYILIASRRGDPMANEGALKYFTLGAVASSFLLFGIALVYGESGSLDIAASLAGTSGIAGPLGAVGTSGILALGLGLILVGIGFKTSLAPFHLWTADVYQGAPAPVTAFLSTGSKAAVFAALLRFAVHVPDAQAAFLGPAVWTMAGLTMLAGNLAALNQTRIKRMLAYSSVGQMGYLLMTLPAARQPDSGGAAAIVFYLALYVLMDLGAFGAVAMLSLERSPGSPGERPDIRAGRDLDDLAGYRGLGQVAPWRAALLALCLLSLAGLPPTGGFFGKLGLFQATIRAGFPGLAVTGIVAAIVSVFFYLKVIVILYMHDPEPGRRPPSAGASALAAGALIFLLVLALGLYPAPLLDLTRIVP